MRRRKITVIGSGVAGLSAASYLAKAGHKVTLLEKNSTTGGRARHFQAEGFLFDMGPSWYWMPDVFEQFYNAFGYTTKDFYQLERVAPSYRVFWKDGSQDDVPANLDEFYAWFEKLEPGSTKKLDQFLNEAAYKYEVGMNDLVHKPSLKITEFADMRIVKGSVKLHLFSSFSKYIKSYFSHPKIIELLEFPILFLGAMPKDTPALYSLMNYADIKELNRSYFPNVAMTQFKDIIKKEIEADIEIDFEKGLEGIKKLPKKARFGTYMAYIYYYKLFVKIKNTKAESIMKERVRIPNNTKYMLFFSSLVRHKLNLI